MTGILFGLINGEKKMLVLRVKQDEEIILDDEVSKSTTVIRIYYQDGHLKVAFEAPEEVQISRRRRRAIDDNNR